MDRRHSPRIPLDAPCLLTLIVNYEDELQAMAVDVSRGGIQLALPPGPYAKELEPGMPVTLRGVPEPLDRILEGVHGKVAWVGIRCCGVKLNKDLTIAPEEITDFARL